nr:Rap1a/Tai family immunity protein [uncultured Rhodopila sp.]
MIKPVVLALACVTLSLPARAAEPVALHVRSAGDLAELCGANPRAPEADAKINYCHGFAQAAVDLELAHAGDKKPFCFPSPAPSRAATLNEFASWVHSIPERRTLPPFEGLFRFLGERFPCK